ncbi:M28 family peptidase [bacterium]|nr:M28 family peptidase [bacterium]
MRYFLLSFLLFFCTGKISAQDFNYARKAVNILASDSLKGRGYVDNGDKLAADFIRSEFEKFGLQAFNGSFYQEFETSVNTFPDRQSIVINGKELEAGKDYLLDPGSPSLKGSFDVMTVTATEILDNAKFVNKLRVSSGQLIAVLPFDKSNFSKEQNEQLNGVINFLKYHPQNPSKGTIILTNDKLTWAGSVRQNSKPTIIIHSDSLNGSLKSLKLDIKNLFIKKYSTQNVIGYVEGKNTDSTIVFIAHYDHLGMLGPQATFNGANDNASGTAMLLSLAKHYSENKPNYNTVFIAFGAEELGLIGSKYFTENPLFPLSEIKFLMNFDLAGTGDEGVQVVNGSVYRKQFDELVQINEDRELLPNIKIRGAACNSDHCMFDQQDVPGFYVYTLGGIQAYHDVYDRPETLPLTEFENYFKLIVEFIDQL